MAVIVIVCEPPALWPALPLTTSRVAVAAATVKLFEVRFSGPELEKLAELLGRLPEAAAAADSCSP